MAIFPIVFANHLEPSMGAGLIFQTLPLAFGQMPGGASFGALFFVLIFFAAITSSIALIEPAVAWLTENRGWTRGMASFWSGFACWVFGLGTVYSFGGGAESTWFGKNFFELIDFVTSDLMLPAGGLLIALFAGWVMERPITEAELEMGPGPGYRIWLYLIRFVAPAGVVLIFLRSVGLF
jgi:NSS family neurotransmitter:Na+ symporter